MNRISYTLLIFLLVCFFWAISGVHPASSQNWLAESHVYFWLLPVVVVIVAYVRLSKLSVTLIGIFLVLHVVGMHYNYGSVPFGSWLGHLLGSERNMYDRLVHFSFGLLMFIPVREILLRVKGAPGFFSYFVPLNIILSFSALYEIMEWHTVSKLNSSIGYLFIGGNDPFDAEKDMVMALVGASLVLVFVFVRYLLVTKNVKGKILHSWREHRIILVRNFYKPFP